jgi:predicted transposase/invertase (TIGR01784 family)
LVSKGYSKPQRSPNSPPEEREAYEESLKYYRDLKNVVDTSREEGREEEKVEIAKAMKKNGEPIEKIMTYTGLTEEEIKAL